VFTELATLCSSLPHLCKNNLKGKTFKAYQLQTKQLSCLVELYNLFYIQIDGKDVKCIKRELLDYLDYQALAH